MARKNPALIKGTLAAASIPKGKKKGQLFTKGGKRYMVISYTTKTGKRVRYAQAVSKCASPAKKRTCKTKRSKARKNPYTTESMCDRPHKRGANKPGFTYIDHKGRMCVVQRIGKKVAGKKRRYGGFAHTAADGIKPHVRGRKIGTRFQFNNQKYVVATRKTRAGGYKKYAKKVG